jgi:hypothetical protein
MLIVFGLSTLGACLLPTVFGATNFASAGQNGNSPSISQQEPEPAPEPEPQQPSPTPAPTPEPQKPKVELYLDNWFDFVNEYWTKYNQNALVIDVATLKTYTVLRVGGYNHADVEPINKTETATILSLYNGTWQWTRRPVWVKIKDRYIAASINGMPHSYDYVANNNMTGHTCIHFYMSRTHGTNNWDPAHRAAVDTAFNSKEKFEYYIKNYT